jgi:SulP family sulfate permease
MVYRVFGAFLFGAADKLETALKRAHEEPDVLILKMQNVLAMDATGLNALEDIYEKLHAKGKYLVLSGPHTQPLVTMQKDGFIDQLGDENVCPHLEAALERAQEILKSKGTTQLESAVGKPVTGTSR